MGFIIIMVLYIIIGMVMFYINSIMSKRKFFMNFDPERSDREQKLNHDVSKYIYGDDWPFISFVVFWPMLVFMITAINIKGLVEDRFAGNHNDAIKEYYEKYPEKKL